MFVSHAPPGDQGWYPAQYGRGWVSGKGRAGYIVLAVIDVLHHFPGERQALPLGIFVGKSGPRRRA